MPVSVSGSASLRRKLDALGEVAKGRTMVRALVAGGLVIQNDAKRHVPRVSGNLARSIHIGGHEELNTEGGSVTQRTSEPVPAPDEGSSPAIYIGTDVEYARRIEFGFEGPDALGRTYHQPAQPYMRPAVDTNRSEVAREVGEALRDLVKAAAQ